VKRAQLLGLVGLLVTFAACFGCNLCKDEIVDKSRAPEGNLTAITRMRDCGATTTETMWVSLQDDPARKDDARAHVLVLKHIHRLHVSWKDKDTLVIDCRDCTPNEIRLQVTKLDSTRIEYE
jgi:Fe-S-cluster-containing hydrogenase component 2